MFPITLFCASRTGKEVTLSLFMSSRAAARGLSPLFTKSVLSSHFMQDVTYLMAMTECDPRFKSLISDGYN